MSTTKVKILAPMCGHRTDKDGRVVGVYTYKEGDIADLPAGDAERLVNKGYATKDTK